jgi:hypothetical protein
MFKTLRFFPEDGAGELVGARCGLPAAGVAQELCRDIFGAHAFAELRDCLQVSVASARKADISDFVSVARELDRCRANASGLESLFHMCLGVEGVR